MSANQICLCLCLIFTMHWTLTNANTPIRKCADISNPLPLMVQIDDCAELPCDLWKGTESNIAIQFVATRDSTRQLKAAVRLTSLGITLPYDLEESRGNVCDNLLHGAYCPLDFEEDVVYQLLLPVEDHQLEVATRLEVTLIDAADQSVVACFLTDTRVKKPSSSMPLH